MALIGIPWAVGAARGVIDNSMLHVGTAIVIATSFLLLATELRHFPQPYDPRLAAEP
jgi:hypothetical protein